MYTFFSKFLYIYEINVILIIIRVPTEQEKQENGRKIPFL